MAFEPYAENFSSKKIEQYLNEFEIKRYSKILSPIQENNLEEINESIKTNNIGEYVNSVFAFVAMPLNPFIPVFPLLYVPMESGKANKKILQILKNIIESLKQENIKVKYISSDGDNSYDRDHITVFERYSHLLFNDADTIFATIEDYNLWIISDILHLLKIARNRLKNRIFLFNTTDYLSGEQINKILKLGTPLLDFGSCAKLKDSYPTAVFTLNNFLKLYEKRKTWSAAIYLLPYSIIETFLYNSSISSDLRLHLIKIAFKFFEYFYLYRIKTEKIGDKMTKGMEGVNFATEINIIRIMNTLIAYYSEIKKDVPIGLSRLGTQPIENLFGQIRSNSQKESNWSYLKNSIIVTCISKIFKENFGIKTKIRTRVSTGGIRLGISEKNENKIKMNDYIDVDNLMCTLKEKSSAILEMNDEEYEDGLQTDYIYRYFLQLCIEISKNKKNESKNCLQSKIVATRIMARLMER